MQLLPSGAENKGTNAVGPLRDPDAWGNMTEAECRALHGNKWYVPLSVGDNGQMYDLGDEPNGDVRASFWLSVEDAASAWLKAKKGKSNTWTAIYTCRGLVYGPLGRTSLKEVCQAILPSDVVPEFKVWVTVTLPMEFTGAEEEGESWEVFLKEFMQWKVQHNCPADDKGMATHMDGDVLRAFISKLRLCMQHYRG